jgi:hypothetical protein
MSEDATSSGAGVNHLSYCLRDRINVVIKSSDVFEVFFSRVPF